MSRNIEMDRVTAGLARQDNPGDQLSVVCFGASSGGFEAYCTILSLLPADTEILHLGARLDASRRISTARSLDMRTDRCTFVQRMLLPSPF